MDGLPAAEVREFDLDKKRFVPESEGGFKLPEAKSQAQPRRSEGPATA